MSQSATENITTCPACESSRVQRVGTWVEHDTTRHQTVPAYWNLCLDCSYQWDGITDGGVGILPAYVYMRSGTNRRIHK